MIYFESPGETSLPTWMSLGSANKSTESKFWVMGNRHLQFFLLKKDIYLFIWLHGRGGGLRGFPGGASGKISTC